MCSWRLIIKLKVFNSDIILGKYDKDINIQFTQKLAQVIFSIYKDNSLCFVIGKDTRVQNYELEKTLAKVLSSLGGNVFLLGTTSTGAVSFATKAYKATAGIMITGSSKPNEFVGFKIFNGNGYKISDEQIESIKYKFKNISQLSAKKEQGRVFYKPYFNFEYINYLKNFSKINQNANSIKILADLSCGSAEEIYEELCLALGIKTFLAYGGHDCEKINHSYLRGASLNKTNVFITQDYFGKIKSHKDFFDFKIVFDGDCDKLLLYTREGNRIPNEKLLMLFARYKQKQKKQVKIVLGPIVNTKALEFFDKYKIEYIVETSSVKQKKLINKAIETNAQLCGDNFGNVIFMENEKTSDAFLTLIEFLNIYTQDLDLVKEVLDFELNPKYVKKIKVAKNFDIDEFKDVFSLCEFSLLEYGKIFAFHNKFLSEIEIHLETVDKDIKNDIFDFLQTFFSKDSKIDNKNSKC
jgi:phosphoglucosamine mutase